MITHEFDLDALAGPSNRRAPGVTEIGSGKPVPEHAATSRPSTSRSWTSRTWWSRTWSSMGAIPLLALMLAGVAIGAVMAAAPAGRSVPPPLTSVLSVLDVSLSGTTPAVLLRLTLTNPGESAISVTGLVIKDARATTTFTNTTSVAAQTSRTVDIAAHPTCPAAAAGAAPTAVPLSGYVQVAGGSQAPLLLDEEAGRPGGLCAVLDQTLPRGWRTPATATSATFDGDDLVLEVPGLGGRRIAGSDPNASGVVVTSAYVGERLAAASVTDQTQLRLIGPAPCVDGSATGTVPMSIRLLVHGSGEGLQSVLVQVGPELAAWVTASCAS